MKDSYYFSHDSNARTDERILKVRSKHGAKGYGIYFMLIEMLRDANAYRMQCDFNAISYEIHELEKDVKDIIENYDLFEIEDGCFWSKSLLERMKIREEKSQKARESAEIRWNNANAMRTQCDANAIKERKVKEIKGKESTLGELGSPDSTIPKKEKEFLYSSDFIEFWEAYPKKQGKGAAWYAWQKIKSRPPIDEIVGAVEMNKACNAQWLKNSGQFIPNPATWLNQRRWEDVIENKSNAFKDHEFGRIH